MGVRVLPPSVMSAGSEVKALVTTVPMPPSVPLLKLERLRRELESRLFGSPDVPVEIDRDQIPSRMLAATSDSKRVGLS